MASAPGSSEVSPERSLEQVEAQITFQSDIQPDAARTTNFATQSLTDEQLIDASRCDIPSSECTSSPGAGAEQQDQRDWSEAFGESDASEETGDESANEDSSEDSEDSDDELQDAPAREVGLPVAAEPVALWEPVFRARRALHHFTVTDHDSALSEVLWRCLS